MVSPERRGQTSEPPPRWRPGVLDVGDMVCSFPILYGALGPVATALPSSRGPAGSECLTLGPQCKGVLRHWPGGHDSHLSPNGTTCCFSFIRNLTTAARKAYVVSHRDTCCLVTRGWRQTFPRLSLQGEVTEQR